MHEQSKTNLVTLDSIQDVDVASAEALNKVMKRRHSLPLQFGRRVSIGKRMSGGLGDFGHGRTLALSPSTRRASLLGRMSSVCRMLSLRDFDLDLEEVSGTRASVDGVCDVKPFGTLEMEQKDQEEEYSEEEEDFASLEMEQKDQEEEYSEEEEDLPRPSVLSIPEFDIASVFQRDDDFDPSCASGSVDLGTKRYFAKMKDFAPRSFDVMGEKKVLLGVSLGSKNTELACLDAMFQYISANFEECTIMPGDYIYRLTLQLKYGFDDQVAEEEAIRAQQEYRAMCTTVLAQYAGICKFKWRPFSEVVKLYPEEFHHSYSKMKMLYQNDKAFRDSVRGFSEMYIARIHKEDAAEAAVVSIRYLLEECAILNCIAMENPTTMVYAGSIQSIKDICAGKFDNIPKAMRHNLRFVEVAVSPRGKFFPSGERKVLKIGELTVGDVERPSFSRSMDLDEATMKKIIKVAQEARPKVGTSLVTAGKPCKEFILIRKGRAEELLKREDGSLQRLAVLEAGSIVGADAFFDGKASPVTVNTLEACECSKITMKKFNPLIQKDPELVIALLKEITRLQSIRARLLMYEFQNMRI